MKKMKLEVESLAVESFDTTPEGRAARGTVRGHDTEEPVDHFETQNTYCTCPCPPTDYTACGQASCTCPPAHTYAIGATCTEPSCGLTLCVDSCDYCMSISSQAPQYCTPVPGCVN